MLLDATGRVVDQRMENPVSTTGEESQAGSTQRNKNSGSYL